MADTIEIQDTNEWLSEISRRAQQLVDLIKAGYDVGQSGELGNLALFDYLADCQVGDANKLREKIGAEFREFGLGSFSGWRSSLNDPDSLFDAPGSCFVAPSGSSADPQKWWNVYAPSLWIVRHSGAAVLLSFSSDGKAACRHANPRERTWNSGWLEFITEGNSTVDSNGFIKSASPIFRLTGNAGAATDAQHSEAGAGAANSKASGVTAEHVDTGHYVVRGALGLHNEGWTVELPRDSTGKHQCLAATDTADDGTITVRTYAVVIDPRGIEVPGEPIDIAGEGWVTIRLCMPAKPTEEEPEPATPTPGPDVVLGFVTPWTYKLDIWERMTDDEAETFEESFNATSAKNRGLWRDCRYIAHDSPLFDTLRGMMIEQWGEARADELLAPSA